MATEIADAVWERIDVLLHERGVNGIEEMLDEMHKYVGDVGVEKAAVSFKRWWLPEFISASREAVND